MAERVESDRGSPTGARWECCGGNVLRRVNARGETTYYARIQYQGIEHRIPAGADEEKAHRKVAALREDIAKHRLLGVEWKPPKSRAKPAAPAPKPDLGPTFKDFGEKQFLKKYANHTRSDFYEERLTVLNKTFGARRMRDITKADLDAFAAQRARVVKPSTVRRDLATLRVLFKMAVRWGVLVRSPAVDLVGPKEPPHRTRFLTRDEWGRLDQHAPPWLRPILQFAVLSGFRLKEITGLRWDDYDKRAGTVTLSGDNKTGSVRTVPVSTQGRAILDARVRHLKCPNIFTSRDGKPYTDEKSRARISQNTRAAMQAAGIAGASFHSLRHHADFRIMPTWWGARARAPWVPVIWVP